MRNGAQWAEGSRSVSLDRTYPYRTQKIRPETAKRTLDLAAAHRWLRMLFLLMVILQAFVGVVNPLIYRDIINNRILKANSPLIIKLAILVVGLGLLDAGLGLTQSYLPATIGTRIVLSLRTKLFEHIQQMPLAFFPPTA